MGESRREFVEEACRAVSRFADLLRAEGMHAHASIAQTIADNLAVLSFLSRRAPIIPPRASNDVLRCATGLGEIGRALHDAGFADECEAAGMLQVALRDLARELADVTRPMDRVG